MILLNKFNKIFLEQKLAGGFLIVSVIFIFGAIFGFVTLIRTDNHIAKASDRIIVLNDYKKYNEAIYVAENIKVSFALDTDYTKVNTARFTNSARFSLANSYNQVGKSELATALYLDILGYSEEEYKAMQLLNIQKEYDLERLAIFAIQHK